MSSYTTSYGNENWCLRTTTQDQEVEWSEIGLGIDGQLIDDKGGKNVQWGKACSINGFGKPGPLYTKVHSSLAISSLTLVLAPLFGPVSLAMATKAKINRIAH